MSEIKLFRVASERATEIGASSADLERPLQRLVERNLEALLGVRFLATEYSTGKTHAGRIDTLGIDENNCPVIIEYKRSTNENVINQGLFYLDWLLDHRAEFKQLASEQLHKDAASKIDWSAPRLICIAADFTRYDAHAIQQIARSIELFRYKRFGNDLLLLELVNAVSPRSLNVAKQGNVERRRSHKPAGPDSTAADRLLRYSLKTRDLFDSLEGYISSLGDDVQRKDLKLYVAFKRIKNFASVEPRNGRLRLYLHLNPSKFRHLRGFVRDVRNIGHWGTGDLEVAIQSLDDLKKAKPLIRQAYDGQQ